jgi:hypothetical protein
MPAASAGANHIEASDAARSLRLRRSWAPEGFHSSSRRREISNRHSVRTMASEL